MENVKKSPFRFEDFYVIDVEMKQIASTVDIDNLKLDIRPYGQIDENNKQFRLFLTVEIGEQEAGVGFVCNVTAMGLFDFKEVVSKENISNYFYTNAPAILFPYVRSYIATLTGLTGYKTIHLPPVNIGTLRQKLIDNTKTI